MSKINRVSVGGQALIEGIMMRGPKCSAMALRMPDGSIEVEEKEFNSLRNKNKFFGAPIVRGIIGFVESLIFGYKCLMESAEKVSFEDVKADNGEDMSKLDRWITDHFGEKMVTVITVISAVLGFLISFGLFFYLPTVLVNWMNKAANNSLTPFRAAIEGVIRIIIFILYMVLVSMMKDIKRMFMYHGAEHKSIFCFESGKELTVENVREMSRFHPRCGTSFMFVMLIISIILSSIVSIAFPHLRDITALWMVIKLLLLPFVMGIGFEFIRYAGTHDNMFVNIVSAPGLWMQRITTNEPTDDIIEVGIASLNAALYGVDKKEIISVENVNHDSDEMHIPTFQDDVSESDTMEKSSYYNEPETLADMNKTSSDFSPENNKKESAESIVDDILAEIMSEKKNDK